MLHIAECIVWEQVKLRPLTNKQPFLLSYSIANLLKKKNQEGAAKHCLHKIIKLNYSTASFQLQNLYLILDQLFRQNLQTVFASAHIINTCDCDDDDDKFSHKQQAPHYRQSSSLCHLLCRARWGLSMCDVLYKMDTLAFTAAFAARINQTEKKKKAANYRLWLQLATNMCGIFSLTLLHITPAGLLTHANIKNTADRVKKINK